MSLAFIILVLPIRDIFMDNIILYKLLWLSTISISTLAECSDDVSYCYSLKEWKVACPML